MVGLEAGQSAFGDMFAWFKQILGWPLKNVLSKYSFADEKVMEQIIEYPKDNMLSVLSEEAKKIPVKESADVATE